MLCAIWLIDNEHCVTGDKFDPVPIANKLKEVADQLQKQWDKDIPAALLRDANQVRVECEIIVQKASFVDLAIFGNCYMHIIMLVLVYLL
jgi:hypothetical protein